jgi:HAD superfamily hydrolase (TIGR01549 family)
LVEQEIYNLLLRRRTLMSPNIRDFFNKKKGIIFDCDGVIINSRDANVKFYNLILKELGLPNMNKDQEDYVHSHTVYESIKYIVPEYMFKKALEIGKEISYTAVLDSIRLEDGIIDFLNILKEQGKKCAINTNRTNTMSLILSTYKLEPYFQPVVTAETIKNPKPHPESVFFILKKWSVNPTEVLFIGDSKVDELTAKNVPIDFVSYKNNKLNGVFYISNYRELAELLKK